MNLLRASIGHLSFSKTVCLLSSLVAAQVFFNNVVSAGTIEVDYLSSEKVTVSASDAAVADIISEIGQKADFKLIGETLECGQFSGRVSGSLGRVLNHIAPECGHIIVRSENADQPAAVKTLYIVNSDSKSADYGTKSAFQSNASRDALDQHAENLRNLRQRLRTPDKPTSPSNSTASDTGSFDRSRYITQ